MSGFDVEFLASEAIDSGLQIHRRYGSGLLESAYEALLMFALQKKGFRVERQRPMDLAHEGGLIKDAFRIDLLVESQLIIEVKSVERFSPAHAKQLLTYLRVTDLKLGLLMNFGCETFGEGLKRVSNNYFGEWQKFAKTSSS
jgi:GxxExxY protein